MTPTEGVPVAWAVVDRHGVLLPNSNEAAEVACFRTKDEADEELAYANQGEGAPPWEDSKPFAVVALAPTHPAAASAEREALVARLARAEEERDEAVGRTSMDIYSHGRVGEARMESIVYELGVCSGWYFDDYDCSVEMLGVRNGWLPTKEERDLLSATGLCGAFLSYLDGTGVLVNLITGEHGPCSPRGTTSDKSALVAKLERERDEALRALASRTTKES